MLLLGGNLGNTEQIFEEALSLLRQNAQLIKKSALYQTEAWGMENTPDFLNQAVILATELDPRAVLQLTSEIEAYLGRRRSSDKKLYESRSLDIDILLYGDKIVDEEGLEIPHPRMHLRNFCLVPVSEIAPQWIHPVLKTSLADLRQNTPDKLAIRKR